MNHALIQWAIKHDLSPDAVKELGEIFGMTGHHLPVIGTTENAVQSAVRLEAVRKGVRLFRNNVGALLDKRGVPVRYGLANDSQAINAVLKSSDLIGWRSIRITPNHVGQLIAQFVSRECKAPGWTYKHTDRERAQLAWLQLVNNCGGDGQFCTGKGTL